MTQKMPAVIETKVISSLEKCFLDESINDKEELRDYKIFRGQKLNCQIAFCKRGEKPFKDRYTLKLTGDLAPYARMRRVINLPNAYPCNATTCDDKYLRKTPGMYPDLLRPMHYRDGISLTTDQLHAVWIDAGLPEDFAAGKYSLNVEVWSQAETPELLTTETVNVELLDMTLPPQRLVHTEWFYTDCIAQYYHTRAFSERHWRLIENFLRTAVENGINMILTPVFTPELDTYIDGERMTTQLLDITVVGKDKYEFGFEKMHRWFDLCQKVGVEYYEIPHFFTQWGAKHAPKIIATVNGKEKKIFGWESDSCGEEYEKFLSQMLPAIVKFLEERGVAEKTYFHVSDEPHGDQLEQYMRCKNLIKPYLKDYPICDALSDYAFYASGASEKPIPAIGCINPFIEHNVPDLWAYYCGDSGYNITGRMFAMPLGRTRILGVQFWLNNIVGFLHWGYNFYNNQYSYEQIDPFLYTSCEFFAPAGDAFLVYPGDNGEAWESMRLNALREAVEDMRLLDLCAQRIGRDRTVEIIMSEAGGTLTFKEYPDDTNFLYRLRDRLISEISAR